MSRCWNCAMNELFKSLLKYFHSANTVQEWGNSLQKSACVPNQWQINGTASVMAKIHWTRYQYVDVGVSPKFSSNQPGKLFSQYWNFMLCCPRCLSLRENGSTKRTNTDFFKLEVRLPLSQPQKGYTVLDGGMIL